MKNLESWLEAYGKSHQNKINKLDGSKVRHKKGFLGLGKYKEVKKD